MVLSFTQPLCTAEGGASKSTTVFENLSCAAGKALPENGPSFRNLFEPVWPVFGST
jgi:hypothetical protein